MQSVLYSSFEKNPNYIIVDGCSLINRLKEGGYNEDFPYLIFHNETIGEEFLILDNTEQNLGMVCRFSYYDSQNNSFYKKFYTDNFIKYYDIYEKTYGLTLPMIKDMVMHYNNLIRNSQDTTQIDKYNNILYKYYLQGIKHNDSELICQLAIQYKNKNDTQNMLKYLNMAAEKQNQKAYYELGLYYKINDDKDNAIKYFKLCSEKDEDYQKYVIQSLEQLSYYFPDEIEYKKKLAKYNSSCHHWLFLHYANLNDYENMNQYWDSIQYEYSFTLDQLNKIIECYTNYCINKKINQYVIKDRKLLKDIVFCYESIFKLNNNNYDKFDGKVFYMLGDYYYYEHSLYNFYMDKDKKEIMCNYFKIGSEKNDVMSIIRLEQLSNNEEEKINYLLRASELGSVFSMAQLANKFLASEKYDEMEKYSVMAFDNGNFSVFKKLAKYYYNQKSFSNDVKLLKLYLIYVDNINWEYNKPYTKYETKLIKYYNDTLIINIYVLDKILSSVFSSMYDQDDQDIINEVLNLIINSKFPDDYKLPPTIKLIKKLVGKELDLMKLHFDYQPGSDGFNEAKKHFTDYLVDKSS